MRFARPGARPGLRPPQATRGREALLALSRRPQAGQSLVEVIVATALMAVGLTIGLTSLATDEWLSSTATQQAWDTCMVRAEAQYLEAAPYSAGVPYLSPAGLQVTVTPLVQTPNDGLQLLTVASGSASATVYKAEALSPPSSQVVQPVNSSWCDQVHRSDS